MMVLLMVIVVMMMISCAWKENIMTLSALDRSERQSIASNTRKPACSLPTIRSLPSRQLALKSLEALQPKLGIPLASSLLSACNHNLLCKGLALFRSGCEAKEARRPRWAGRRNVAIRAIRCVGLPFSEMSEKAWLDPMLSCQDIFFFSCGSSQSEDSINAASLRHPCCTPTTSCCLRISSQRIKMTKGDHESELSCAVPTRPSTLRQRIGGNSFTAARVKSISKIWNLILYYTKRCAWLTSACPKSRPYIQLFWMPYKERRMIYICLLRSCTANSRPSEVAQ